MVVSLRDRFYNQSSFAPTGYVHREFWNLPEREQFDYLIHMHLPWYFSFLMSWHEARCEIGLINTSYEELFTDQVGTLHGSPISIVWMPTTQQSSGLSNTPQARTHDSTWGSRDAAISC